MKLSCFLLFCLTGFSLTFGQNPDLPHDECFHAKELPENQWLEQDNYQATLSSENTRPPKYPGTCIQTFENDLWYKFETQAGREYQITIVHHTCSTPAGLQALLIKGEICDQKQFQIMNCSNRKIADTIKIFFTSPPEKTAWLLYVDGYDGTTCSFDLELRQAPGVQYRPENLAYNRFYTDTLCEVLPLNLSVKFENNQAVLSWTDAQADQSQAYIIEKINAYTIERMGAITPQALAAGYQENYTFQDQSSLYNDGNPYSYRISRIDQNGNRTCSERISGQAKITREFFVTEPVSTSTRGIYKVSYFNKKKQDYTIAILDIDYRVLKAIKIKKLELGESVSQLDLREYPAGIYYFRMSTEKDTFIRKIEKGY